jgi:hypothetical protein
LAAVATRSQAARTRRPKWLRHGPESWSQGSNAGQLSAKRDRVASRLRHRHVLLLLEALLLLRRLLLLPLLRLLLRLLLLLLLLLLLRLLLLPLLLLLLLQLLMLLLQQALLCHVCAVRRLLLMLLLLRLLRQHRCRLRARPRASSVSVRGEEPSCRDPCEGNIFRQLWNCFEESNLKDSGLRTRNEFHESRRQ